MNFISNRPGKTILLPSLLILAALALLGGWLYYTPAGILGKADAIGYAVCHRISVRSYFFGDRQFSLCARCSGMYLGALAGILYQMKEGRRGGMPARKILVVLVIFLVAFGIDGVNSYLHFFPNFAGLYQPENWLRLVTGTGVGLGIAGVLIPVVRQTLWDDYSPEPALRSWRQLGVLILLVAVLDLALVSEIPLLLFPLALLSTGTVFAILTLVYTVVWTMVTRQENHFHSWNDRRLLVLLLAGMITALAQIAGLDAARYALTHTWEGFNNLVR